MVEEIKYKDFSLHTHRYFSESRRPSVCQFELTFACGLRCPHCYAGCFNRPQYIRRQLKTVQVKRVLEKLRTAGVLWLCLTGGDPLARPDFLEIYSYARKAGFIVTVFTNGFSMTESIADGLAKIKPFSVEITLNALEAGRADLLTGVKGALPRILHGIELLRRRGIPLRIKTQVTRSNYDQVPVLRRFARSKGFLFRPDPFLFARLDGDTAPCEWRVSPGQARSLLKTLSVAPDDCEHVRSTASGKRRPFLFSCAMINGNGMHVDPTGKMFLCQCLRNPNRDLRTEEVLPSLRTLLSYARKRRFSSGARCSNCALYDQCFNCPGRAYLETGSADACVDYYCHVAQRRG